MIKIIKNQLDDRGVSPVIGVILMVAITVILAAVIGSFVLGIGGDVEKAPQASLSMDDSNNGGYANVTHNGGDTLDTTKMNVIINGNDAGTLDSFGSDELGPGQEIEIDDDTNFSEGQNTVRIVHNPSDQVVLDTEVRVTP